MSNNSAARRAMGPVGVIAAALRLASCTTDILNVGTPDVLSGAALSGSIGATTLRHGAIRELGVAYSGSIDGFVVSTGNMSDALEALVDGKFVTLRVPYPMGFHAKGMDGRIDDATLGWKGRGVWSTYAGRAPFHIEGGKGTTSKVVKFQLRPDPLAR